MSAKDILTELILFLKISKSEFARKISISPQALHSYFSGHTKTIKENFAYRVLKAYPEININFLLKGEKPIMTGSSGTLNISGGLPENVKEQEVIYLKQQIEIKEMEIEKQKALIEKLFDALKKEDNDKNINAHISGNFNNSKKKGNSYKS